MRPFALLLLAVSVDAGPSCEKCNARDYRIEVEVRNASSFELIRVQVNDLPPTPPPPGGGAPSASVPFRSFEKPHVELRLLVSPPARAPGEPRVVMPAAFPDLLEVEKGRPLVIEITDAGLHTKCTGMSRAEYEAAVAGFPGVPVTPWDDVRCP